MEHLDVARRRGGFGGLVDVRRGSFAGFASFFQSVLRLRRERRGRGCRRRGIANYEKNGMDRGADDGTRGERREIRTISSSSAALALAFFSKSSRRRFVSSASWRLTRSRSSNIASSSSNLVEISERLGRGETPAVDARGDDRAVTLAPRRSRRGSSPFAFATGWRARARRRRSPSPRAAGCDRRARVVVAFEKPRVSNR